MLNSSRDIIASLQAMLVNVTFPEKIMLVFFKRIKKWFISSKLQLTLGFEKTVFVILTIVVLVPLMLLSVYQRM